MLNLGAQGWNQTFVRVSNFTVGPRCFPSLLRATRRHWMCCQVGVEVSEQSRETHTQHKLSHWASKWKQSKVKIRTHARAHTYRLFCDFRHSTFCWLWQPAGTPGSSRSRPREALAWRETLLSGVQIKETRYNVLIGHRQGLKEINFFPFFFSTFPL